MRAVFIGGSGDRQPGLSCVYVLRSPTVNVQGKWLHRQRSADGPDVDKGGSYVLAVCVPDDVRGNRVHALASVRLAACSPGCGRIACRKTGDLYIRRSQGCSIIDLFGGARDEGHAVRVRRQNGQCAKIFADNEVVARVGPAPVDLIGVLAFS